MDDHGDYRCDEVLQWNGRAFMVAVVFSSSTSVTLMALSNDYCFQPFRCKTHLEVVASSMNSEMKVHSKGWLKIVVYIVDDVAQQ